MDLVLIIGVVAVVLLAIVALYFIVTKKSKGQGGDLRKDKNEPSELTGTEQYKRREFK